MKDRIKEYMDYKNINAGELASMLEVQRSNISHILNGRNKPGAAFIEKMLLVFQDLNARWLLTGIGEMTESNHNSDKSAPTELKQPIQQDILPKQTSSEERSEKIETKSEINTAQILSSDAVEKIILLYKDGTFSTFQSKK